MNESEELVEFEVDGEIDVQSIALMMLQPTHYDDGVGPALPHFPLQLQIHYGGRLRTVKRLFVQFENPCEADLVANPHE
jgi:hypothetical protein